VSPTRARCNIGNTFFFLGAALVGDAFVPLVPSGGGDAATVRGGDAIDATLAVLEDDVAGIDDSDASLVVDATTFVSTGGAATDCGALLAACAAAADDDDATLLFSLDDGDAGAAATDCSVSPVANDAGEAAAITSARDGLTLDKSSDDDDDGTATSSFVKSTPSLFDFGRVGVNLGTFGILHIYITCTPVELYVLSNQNPN
jgi:hypothetical protein